MRVLFLLLHYLRDKQRTKKRIRRADSCHTTVPTTSSCSMKRETESNLHWRTSSLIREPAPTINQRQGNFLKSCNNKLFFQNTAFGSNAQWFFANANWWQNKQLNLVYHHIKTTVVVVLVLFNCTGRQFTHSTTLHSRFSETALWNFNATMLTHMP